MWRRLETAAAQALGLHRDLESAGLQMKDVAERGLNAAAQAQ